MTLDEFAQACNWMLYVVEVDGVSWATDTYWMAPYSDSLAQRLLAVWNLDGLGEYEIVQFPPVQVSRRGDPPKKATDAAAALLTATPATPAVPLTVVCPVRGRPSFIKIYDDYCAVTTRPDGERVLIKEDLLRIVGGTDWAVRSLVQYGGPLMPVWLDPGVASPGLLMPIRMWGEVDPC